MILGIKCTEYHKQKEVKFGRPKPPWDKVNVRNKTFSDNEADRYLTVQKPLE